MGRRGSDPRRRRGTVRGIAPGRESDVDPIHPVHRDRWTLDPGEPGAGTGGHVQGSGQDDVPILAPRPVEDRNSQVGVTSVSFSAGEETRPLQVVVARDARYLFHIHRQLLRRGPDAVEVEWGDFGSGLILATSGRQNQHCSEADDQPAQKTCPAPGHQTRGVGTGPTGPGILRPGGGCGEPCAGPIQYTAARMSG